MKKTITLICLFFLAFNANAGQAQSLCAKTTGSMFKPIVDLKKMGLPEESVQNMVVANAGGEPAQSIMASMVSTMYSAPRSTSDSELNSMMVKDCVNTLQNMGLK